MNPVESVDAMEHKRTPDPNWLAGTNINEVSRNTRRREELIQKNSHVKHSRSRPKARKTVASTSDDFSNLGNVERMKRDTIRSHSASPFSDGYITTKRRRRNTAGSDIASPGKSISNDNVDDHITRSGEADDQSIESDGEFNVSKRFGSSIFCIDSYAPTESDCSDAESIRNADTETLFEQSMDVDAENLEEGIKETEQNLIMYGADLSPRFVDRCGFRDKMNYYTDNTSVQELKSLLRNDTRRFKKCVLKIESAHKAIGELMEPNGDLKEIEISGRSKCGKNFMEDEVVVEILSDGSKECSVIPRLKKALKSQEAQKTFGKVVGRLDRTRFRNIDHPVLVCELDEIEYHLMRPLDKTVPKLHIFNKHVENDFQVEVYDYDSSSCELKYSHFVNINPALKHSYVFLVVFIRWDAVYPLGAVIKVMRSDGGTNSGLKILELQHQVPTIYSSDTVQSVQSIMCRMPEEPTPILTEGRIDLSESLSIFTIDPKNSKDLDDALSIKQLEDDNVTEVGIHIADVTSYIHKGSPIDEEAKVRATTFYPGQSKQPYHMLPEPLSQNLCSLLPNKKRLALSVFLYFSQDGKQLTNRTRIQKTVVKSRRQFTYQDVQDIILERTDKNEAFASDIIALFKIAKACRFRRLGDSMHSLPTEVDLLNEREGDSMFDTLEAHFLVEEFMILANMSAAACVCSSFRNSAILRCQDAPSAEKVKVAERLSADC
ncbi:probable exosome complex exonuclease RRP44 isoform X2 [Argopecten irradians]|uniref:probable exosome complex exonuclease RRP44 isoform X2 n=1 Tax=Argopecten irradians TaxID=31199 RepID=UPI00370F8B64